MTYLFTEIGATYYFKNFFFTGINYTPLIFMYGGLRNVFTYQHWGGVKFGVIIKNKVK